MHLRHFVTLLLIGILAAGLRIAPAAADQTQRSEWLLAADATTDKAGEPTASQIAQVVRRLKPKTGAMVVAWSPDGKLLAAMGGLRERVTLWDARTGDVIWEEAGDLGGGEALAFSNDGRLLLVSTMRSAPEDEHSTLTLLDVSSGAVAGRVAGPFPNEGVVENFARKIALDRQDGLMAVIAFKYPGRPVGLYDMRDWALKGTVAVEGDTPEALAFGPDGTLAVGTIGGKVALFDARTRTPKCIISTDSPIVGSFAYGPDGKYLIAGSPLRIWSAADATLVRSYSDGSSSVHGLAWSPDGRYVASASFDKTIRLWPFAGDGRSQIVATSEGGVWSVAFSPDGKFLAGGGARGVIIAEIK